MVTFFPSMFTSPSHDEAPHAHANHQDSILAIALSALSLLVANQYEHSNPMLATIFRCTAGGIAITWLISKLCSKPHTHHHHATAPHVSLPMPAHAPASPPSVHIVPPVFRENFWDNLFKKREFITPQHSYANPHYADSFYSERHMSHHTTRGKSGRGVVSPGPFPSFSATSYRTPVSSFPAVSRVYDPTTVADKPLSSASSFPAVTRVYDPTTVADKPLFPAAKTRR